MNTGIKTTANQSHFVILITGPMGAGKSSVSNALAKKFERSAVIEVDKLRGMIKEGYVMPSPYTEESALQLSLSVKNACDIANNFLEKGFNVIIDGIVGRKLLEQYSNFLKGKNFKAFLLLPSPEALLARFDDRGSYEELRERTTELHKIFSEKRDQLNLQTLDSSDQTLEETVDEIYKSIVSL